MIKTVIHSLLIVICALLISGCELNITRIGYHLPPGKTSKDLPKGPLVIKADWKYDADDVQVLGIAYDHDSGGSVNCSEADVLDIFCREGTLLGADVVNITEEKQPGFWTSTCYRARAQFIRLKDREKVKDLVSDARFVDEMKLGR